MQMRKRKRTRDVKQDVSAQKIREYFNTPYWNKVKKKNYGFI